MKLQKHTMNLREGDFEYLDTVYGPRGVKASIVIRKLVSRLVDTLQNGSPSADEIAKLEIENDELS